MLISWEFLKPKPIDWSVTLTRKDKIPYGTYVLYNTLKDIFPERKIIENKKTFYRESLILDCTERICELMDEQGVSKAP